MIAAFAASCNPRANSLPSTTLIPTETDVLRPSIEATSDRAIIAQAREAFFEQLSLLSTYPDPIITDVYNRLHLNQRSGNLSVRMSPLRFNSEGRLEERHSEIPVVCGFLDNELFLISVNSNLYAQNSTYPLEASAAALDQCLNFREVVLEKYQVYQQSNPNSTLDEAFRHNPEWEVDSSLDAWYQTAGGILSRFPREVSPDARLLYILSVYDLCAQDRECFRNTFLDTNPDRFEHL